MDPIFFFAMVYVPHTCPEVAWAGPLGLEAAAAAASKGFIAGNNKTSLMSGCVDQGHLSIRAQIEY